MSRSRGFWLAYAAAWVPYAVSYAAIFAADGRHPARQIGTAVLCNIVPAALLGVPVLALSSRLRWARARRPAFFVAHAAGSAVYSVLWWATVSFALSAAHFAETGGWELTFLWGAAFHWQLFSGLMVYGTLASVGSALEVAATLREERERAARAEAARAEAELRALRAQLNPHFLFNTLHSLMALIRYSPDEAESALERFAGMLRYALGAERSADEADVSLAEEWAFVESYLALERLRLGDRIRVETRVDPEALDCALPALTLQPLVENAVRHGIAPVPGPGLVCVAAVLEGGDLVISVRDEGPGCDLAELENAHGLGLAAIRRRLGLRYGARSSVTVDTAPGQGFGVTVRMPAAAGRRASPEEVTCQLAR